MEPCGPADKKLDPSDVLDSMRAVLSAAERGQRLPDVREGPMPPRPPLPLPDDSFSRGVQAHRDAQGLTPAALDDGHGNGHAAVALEEEPPRPIKFPKFYRTWFASKDERDLGILSKLLARFTDRRDEDVERRLVALDQVLDAWIAKENLRRLWSRTWKIGLWLVPMAWSAMFFAADRVGKAIEQLPVIRGVWKAIMGNA